MNDVKRIGAQPLGPRGPRVLQLLVAKRSAASAEAVAGNQPGGMVGLMRGAEARDLRNSPATAVSGFST